MSVEIQEPTPTSDGTPRLNPLDPRGKETVPEHLQALLQGALPCCTDEDDRKRLQQLLVQYADIFSRSATDVGRTSIVKHSIPTQANAAPIKQHARRLGPEKEKEVSRQVTQLAEAGMIEPSSSAAGVFVLIIDVSMTSQSRTHTPCHVSTTP